MQEVKINNLELFYDCLDESNNYLYEIFKKPYFELLEMTVENIMANDVCQDLNKTQINKLKRIYGKLKNVDFTVEDIRKAVQSIVLRGFKETHIPNGNTTPDTMGILFAYLITKICKKKEINLLDPLCGTGNLLFTIANHLEMKTNLYGCDDDYLMTKITAMSSDLLQYPVEIFYQDTLTLVNKGFDAIVFDMPHTELNDGYFPYKAINHYVSLLNDDGAMIGLVENDFFDYDKDQSFKNELFKEMSIIGLVELPDSMFKASKPKLILVLQKKKLDDAKCFMVKLPSVDDVKEFNEALIDINAWFEKNNYNK